MVWNPYRIYVSVPRETPVVVSLGNILANYLDPCSFDARMLARLFAQSGMPYITTVEGLLSDLIGVYQELTNETIGNFQDNSIYRFAGVLIPGGISKEQTETHPYGVGWWHISGDIYIEDPNPGG